MRYRIGRLCGVVGGFLVAPSVAVADFAFTEIPQYAADQAPNWLFQILASILLAFAQVLGGLLGLGTTG